MLKRLLTIFRPPTSSEVLTTRLTEDEHRLSEHQISKSAVTVIKTLQEAGFLAYLVGGGVRDLLLRSSPKDFDVATNATPEEIKRCFRQALIIGKRFRIVHVRFGREIIEVTTFRGHHDHAKSHRDAVRSESGQLLRDNVYGDLKSDALRRDFTINALYYDLNTREILDFSTGLADLKARRLTIIGDPEARYREDPVRMLRAVRFAAKLGFQLDETTAAPISRLNGLLADVPPARRFEEALKLLLGGSATAAIDLLQQYDLFKHLFPGTAHCLARTTEQERELVSQASLNTDKRIHQNKRVTPAFIYAAFLWLPLQAQMRKLSENGVAMPYQQMLQTAAQNVISQQLSATALPKRFMIPMREIWQLQPRLMKREPKRALSLLEHPRFRAAYDFLLLREASGENMGGAGTWWTQFQDSSDEAREALMKQARSRPTRRRRPRRKPPKPDTSPAGE